MNNNESRSVIIPTSHIWMRIAFEEFSSNVINKARERDLQGAKTRSWYQYYYNNAVDAMRSAFLGGDLDVFYCDDDGIKIMPRGFWRKQVSDRWIRYGEFPKEDGSKEDLFVKAIEFREFVTSNKHGQWPDDIGCREKTQHNKTVYTTPFIDWMIEAINRFDIPDSSPKKDELIRFFLGKKFPDGSPVSRHHAESMATFCRPPEAMKGGNKRIGG